MPAPIRYLSVCSGMEAASVAWEPLGFVPVGFSEIEPFPCAILKHRFPNTTNYGSLTEHHTWPIEQGAVDLLVGGTPCQSFSVAGLRKGMSDPRGNLALTFLSLADRVKPKWIVWENVPGILSSSGGRDFGSFLGALGQLGYGFAYRVLDAQHFGVPQRRRRVFVVACLGDWRAPAEVLSLREGLLGYIEKGKQKRKGTATDAPASVDASGLPIWRAGDQANAEHMIDHAGTVSCNKGSHGGFIAQPTIGTLCARDYKGVGNQYVQEGKCIPCPALTPFRKSKRAQSVTDDESWVSDGKANTLNNFDLGDTRTTHAVVEPVAFTQNQREEVRLLGDKVGAISLPGTHQQNYIAEPIPLDLRNATRDPEKHDEVNPLRTAGGHGAPAVTTPMAVRRLTPVECERLQGFPDNWSRIPWKGKTEEQCPDGPRYKACGNSMAVPVMRWIGERIKEIDANLPK